MEIDYWDRLKVERLHVAPRALELASLAAQRRYGHLWAPVEELLSRLKSLPAGLVQFWLGCPGGHVVLTHVPSRYDAGDYSLKKWSLRNVALVCLSDLVESPLESLVPVGHLLDHLLGCGGAGQGAWLSEAGGLDSSLRDIGKRMAGLFPLGYGFDAAARLQPHDYVARSLSLYVCDRRVLNTADPQMERLLRTTLFSEVFWVSRSHHLAL